jgi:uncharacterized membrane protein
MFQDSTLQIFLTIYHGSLIGTFFYDYIIRNAVRLFLYSMEWTYISNIVLGVVFIAAIIWAILSVWAKIRRNLLICLVVLIIIFIVRLAVGVPDTIEKRRHLSDKQYKEELTVFISQVVVHLFGIIATWLLANNAA